MKMKASYLFFLTLFVSVITYCAAQNHSAFDHFWLVQVWPHGYCLEFKCFRYTSIFILHGLWPVDSMGETLKGTNKSEDEHKIRRLLQNNEPLKDQLMMYWLSLCKEKIKYIENFWIYQWQKHGSAQKVLDTQAYFKRAVDLTKRTDLLNTLAEKGILANGGSYPKVKYKKAIEAKTGHSPILRCFKKDGDFHLKEVIVCVDAEARVFRACNKKYKGNCWANSIKFPAPV